MVATNANRARGRLLIYLGAASGVGKTVAMLKEGRRQADEGRDVVIGYLEPHERPRTVAASGDLETVAPLRPVYRGLTGRELDVDGVLARAPQVALVDELAHTNLPRAGGNPHRWQDVHQVLAAGIDVISTLNIQHVASLGSEIERITGVRQRETIPDEVVHAAAAIRLVDMDPASLRRRLLALHSPDDAERALRHHFRLANLEALRSLTLDWVDAWAAGAGRTP